MKPRKRKLFTETSFDEEVETQPPRDETFLINDTVNRTAINVFNAPMEVDNDISMKAPKRAERMRKVHGCGTPVSSKDSDNIAQTSSSAKPKKLMDITNTKNDSNDETFKIPVNPVSTSKTLSAGKKSVSFDDLHSGDETDTEDLVASRKSRTYAKWSLFNFRQKALEKQNYMGKEGEKIA